MFFIVFLYPHLNSCPWAWILCEHGDFFQALLRRIHPLVSGGERRPNQWWRVARMCFHQRSRSKPILYLEDSKGTSLSTLSVVSVISEIFKTYHVQRFRANMDPSKSKMPSRKSTKKVCSNEPRRMKFLVSPAGLYLLVDLSQGIWSWHVLQSVESHISSRSIFNHFPGSQWPPCEPRPKEVMERTVAWNDVGVPKLIRKYSIRILKIKFVGFHTSIFLLYISMQNIYMCVCLPVVPHKAVAEVSE